MTRPRILVCARPGSGGAARVLESLFRGLADRGITGTAALSTAEGTWLLDAARDHGWDAVRLEMRREISPVRDTQAGLRLRKLARNHDVVHAHAAKAGALARLALPLRKGVPVIYAPHGFHFTYHAEESPAWRKFLGLERRLAPRTTLLHCVSPAERETAISHGLATEESAVVLPNPIPPRRTGERLVLPPELAGKRLVVMVARLAAPKDPVTFVRAAAEIDPAMGARFVLVGEGPLAKRARAADPDGRVTFLPASTPVRPLLAHAHVAALATDSEALPLFLLEALAEGRACVATNIPGCRDAAGDAARYVPDRDPRAMAASVERLLADDDLRSSLERRAKERRPWFTERAFVRGLLAMYRRVLVKPPEAAPE